MSKRFMGHGWSDKEKDNLYVGTLPGRKSIALYKEYNGHIIVLAYFRTQQCAQETLRVLDKWITFAWGVYP